MFWPARTTGLGGFQISVEASYTRLSTSKQTDDGSNLVVGGAAGDSITAGDGFNVVAGDSAEVDAAALGNPHQFGTLPLTLGSLYSLDYGTGGTDTIAVGDGSNLVIGGAAGDAITAGKGTNVVFGDSGEIDWSADGTFIRRDLTLTAV